MERSHSAVDHRLQPAGLDRRSRQRVAGMGEQFQSAVHAQRGNGRGVEDHGRRKTRAAVGGGRRSAGQHSSGRARHVGRPRVASPSPPERRLRAPGETGRLGRPPGTRRGVGGTPAQEERLQVAQEIEAARRRPHVLPVALDQPAPLGLVERRGDGADSGRPVRSANCASAKPSRSRSALSMNSNGSSARATSSSRATARPAERLLDVARRVAVAHLAHDAVRETTACRARRRRCRGSRRTASS